MGKYPVVYLISNNFKIAALLHQLPIRPECVLLLIYIYSDTYKLHFFTL